MKTMLCVVTWRNIIAEFTSYEFDQAIEFAYNRNYQN